LRCGRCGNENAEANRFCGMCGAALVKDPAGGQTFVAVSTGTTAERRTASSAPGAGLGASSERSSGPVITGPSFLGLSAPAGGAGSGRGDHRADGGHDALRPSSNVDYLLEDVEEPHRSRGKMILVVAALALAVGFGYLHWKRGGFDWLNAGEKKPSAAATQTPDSTASPAADAAPQAAAGTATSGANPEESGAGQAAPVPGAAAPAATPQSADPQSENQQNSPQSSAGDSGAAASAPQAADSDADKQAPEVEEKPRVVARKAAAKPAAAKPAAVKPAAGRAGDSVAEAERFIYGRGAAQDCDRGLRILKPAAESNVKAMISMGAMYSTGTCTPRDLPTAYRWFALALHKEPDNQALQEDLQKLWGQMTQPERQLAIKLSQ
jgi:hypothetical protein